MRSLEDSPLGAFMPTRLYTHSPLLYGSNEMSYPNATTPTSILVAPQPEYFPYYSPPSAQPTYPRINDKGMFNDIQFDH